MKLKHLLYVGAALLSNATLTACSRYGHSGLSQAAQASPSQVHQLANGLRVEVLPLERSDIAQTLDMKMWKFNVALPNSQQMLTCNLDVRRNGKTIKRAAGGGAGPFKDGQTEVVIGLHPLSDSWSGSDKFKSVVRIGPNSVSGFASNPFNGYSQTASGDAELQPDGSFLLLVGSKGKAALWPHEKMNDVALVLTMGVIAARSPK